MIGHFSDKKYYGFCFVIIENTVVYTIYIDMQKHERKHVTITGIFPMINLHH